MKCGSLPGSAGGRLAWVDVTKGIAILWIVFFHFFRAYGEDRYPNVLGDGFFSHFLSRCPSYSFLSTVGCTVESVFVGVTQLGFHAVGVFIILSGFGLTYSLAGRDDGPRGGWGDWYRKRLLRIYPMYWVAHLVYLASPFQERMEGLDYRFILSFLGDRIYPLESIFYYLNPAWWFFGMLIQLYLAFPLLFLLLRKMGPGRFLALCGIVTMTVRYLLLNVYPVNGNWVQGGFFVCRLWEFALGIVLGFVCRRSPALVLERMFSTPSLAAGIVMYGLGILSYRSLVAYTFTDALLGTGLFLIMAYVACRYAGLPLLGRVLAYTGAWSYGLYLIHQPYVIYFGLRLREHDMVVFTAAALGVMAVMVFACAHLEKYVNRLVDRVTGGRKRAAEAASS